eukprot:4157334-Karenia_brevis.AAC.1
MKGANVVKQLFTPSSDPAQIKAFVDIFNINFQDAGIKLDLSHLIPPTLSSSTAATAGDQGTGVGNG